MAIGHEHKRRKEEEPKTPSELGHKRKREHLDEPHLPEMKRARHGDHHVSSSSSSSRDVDRHHGTTTTGNHGTTTGKETDHPYSSLERKWRQESSSHEVSSRKQHRSSSPRTPVVAGDKGRSGGSKTHRHSRDPSNKKTAPGGTGQERGQGKVGETANRVRSLDWAAVCNFTEKANSKISYHSSKSILEKFTPAAVFASVTVSPSLAGLERYQRISDLTDPLTKESDLHEFRDFVMEGSEDMKSETDWDKTVSESLGACRRALTASDDYVLRRLLRKDQQRVSILDPHEYRRST